MIDSRRKELEVFKARICHECMFKVSMESRRIIVRIGENRGNRIRNVVELAEEKSRRVADGSVVWKARASCVSSSRVFKEKNVGISDRMNSTAVHSCGTPRRGANSRVRIYDF